MSELKQDMILPAIRPLGVRIVAAALVIALGGVTLDAQTQVFVFGGASSASLTASSVCPPNGGVCSSTTTAAIGMRVPFNMSLSNLYAFQATAPGSGSSCTFTVRTSAAGTAAYATTALSCTITAGNKTCSNTTSNVSVSAGDSIQISFVEVGTCSGYVNFGFRGYY